MVGRDGAGGRETVAAQVGALLRLGVDRAAFRGAAGVCLRLLGLGFGGSGAGPPCQIHVVGVDHLGSAIACAGTSEGMV